MKLPGKSLVDMIVAGVMVGMLLIGAWLGLMAAAVLELVEHDVVATSSAILLGVASNFLSVLKVTIYNFPRPSQFSGHPSGRRDTENT